MTPNQSGLTDQDRMQDLLSQEKSLISGYGTFIPEASNPELRTLLTDNFTGCVNSQFTVFEQMNRMGWYPTKPAPQPDVDAARQKFEQLKGQLG